MSAWNKKANTARKNGCTLDLTPSRNFEVWVIDKRIANYCANEEENSRIYKAKINKESNLIYKQDLEELGADGMYT
jgi:hypothetical protein